MFEDIDSDGPNGTDPFAQIIVQVEEDPIENVTLDLVVGGRAAAPEHNTAPAGSPNEQGPGIPDNPDPFGGVAGNRIELSGTLICKDCPRIDLDLFAPDETSPGGRRMLGKMKMDPGEYVIMVPTGYGPLILEAFIDFDADGPGEGASLFEPLAHEKLIGLDAVSAALCLDMDTSIAAVWSRLNGR